MVRTGCPSPTDSTTNEPIDDAQIQPIYGLLDGDVVVKREVAVLVLTFGWARNYGRRAGERGENLLVGQGGAPQSVFPTTTA